MLHVDKAVGEDGIGPKFYKYFKNERLSVNNMLSDPIRIDRGIRQGCPSAMIIFIIFINVLLSYVERDSLIKKLYLPWDDNTIVKLIAHADDVNFLVADLVSFNRIKIILSEFLDMTGMRINNMKTSIYNISKTLINSDIEHNYQIVEEIKILGVWHGKNSNKKMVDTIFDKLKREVQKWDGSWFYLPERVTLIKSFLYGKIIYYMYTLDWNLNIYHRIEKIIYEYFWQANYELKKRELLNKTKVCGDGASSTFCNFPCHSKYPWS